MSLQCLILIQIIFFFIIFSLFILFLSFSSFGNLLASLTYKFGYKFWIAILTISILLSIFRITFIENISLLIEKILISRYGVIETVVILSILFVISALNYFITINTNVNSKRSLYK